MIKIYIQNKPLLLIDSLTGEIAPLIHQPNTFFTDEFSHSTMDNVISQLEQQGIHQGVILHKNLDALMALFKSGYQVITAAGGLVYTPAKELLLIFRRGKWDLPKGKLDTGETIEECAVREIGEETGVTALHIQQPLQVTYHTYYEREQLILKESHWYLMLTENTPVLNPQLEEDIETCEWVPINRLPAYRDNMHASIKDVLDAGLKILQP